MFEEKTDATPEVGEAVENVSEDVAKETTEVEEETQDEGEDFDFSAFDFSEESEESEEGEEGEEDPEEGETDEDEPEETGESEDTTDYRSELEAEKARTKELLKKLGFESEDEAIAKTKGISVEEYRMEKAKTDETFKAWEQVDIGEIVAAYPELKGKNLKDVLDDPARFASLRGDADMRSKMSAVEAFEFVNRNKLKVNAESAGARKAASKAHLKATKKKNVAPPVTIPRQLEQMLSDAGMTKKEIQKYTTPFLT